MESKIIVDSCVDFNEAVFKDVADFIRIPFKIHIDDEEIVDENLSTYMLTDKMKMSKNKITTSCPSPQDYLDAIDPEKVNYIITISSKLSGSHNAAMVAAALARESHPDCQIHIFDSESAAAGQNLLFMRLKQFIQKKLSPQEIVSRITELIDSMNTFFILNSLDNLAKNGRISNAVALIGKMLKVVPIMGDNGSGEIELKEKVRGKKKAFSRLVELIAEEVSDASERILAITHVHARETAEKLKKAIEETCHFEEIVIFDAGGLSAVYADDGGVILAF